MDYAEPPGWEQQDDNERRRWLEDYSQHEEGNEDMGISNVAEKGGSFTPAPAGNHLANCISIVDIGTHHGEYQGKPTARHQCVISWELCHEMMEDGRPFIVSAFYTASLSEKATLRKHLESWRGRPFTAEELQGFNLKNILGKPCMLNVIHNESNKARVGTVAALPKGMQAPPCVNPLVWFDMEAWDDAVYAGISDGIKNIIADSDEFKQRTAKAYPAQQKTPVGGDDFEDDIPFAQVDWRTV